MSDLENFFETSARQHYHHLCPRQVLGVRIGAYAGELSGLDLPQNDKRLFCIAETDGCLIDGLTSVTNCTVGHRTMHVRDYGKTAATFIDTTTDQAIRILPHPESRKRAEFYAPSAPDRWHAQLEAYQIMPATELLIVQPVLLTISLESLISQHGRRVVCEQCGEDIINERYVQVQGRILCRICAGESYYIQRA